MTEVVTPATQFVKFTASNGRWELLHIEVEMDVIHSSGYRPDLLDTSKQLYSELIGTSWSLKPDSSENIARLMATRLALIYSTTVAVSIRRNEWGVRVYADPPEDM